MEGIGSSNVFLFSGPSEMPLDYNNNNNNAKIVASNELSRHVAQPSHLQNMSAFSMNGGVLSVEGQSFLSSCSVCSSGASHRLLQPTPPSLLNSIKTPQTFDSIEALNAEQLECVDQEKKHLHYHVRLQAEDGGEQAGTAAAGPYTRSEDARPPLLSLQTVSNSSITVDEHPSSYFHSGCSESAVPLTSPRREQHPNQRVGDGDISPSQACDLHEENHSSPSFSSLGQSMAFAEVSHTNGVVQSKSDGLQYYHGRSVSSPPRIAVVTTAKALSQHYHQQNQHQQRHGASQLTNFSSFSTSNICHNNGNSFFRSSLLSALEEGPEAEVLDYPMTASSFTALDVIKSLSRITPTTATDAADADMNEDGGCKEAHAVYPSSSPCYFRGALSSRSHSSDHSPVSASFFTTTNAAGLELSRSLEKRQLIHTWSGRSLNNLKQQPSGTTDSHSSFSRNPIAEEDTTQHCKTSEANAATTRTAQPAPTVWNFSTDIGASPGIMADTHISDEMSSYLCARPFSTPHAAVKAPPLPDSLMNLNAECMHAAHEDCLNAPVLESLVGNRDVPRSCDEEVSSCPGSVHAVLNNKYVIYAHELGKGSYSVVRLCYCVENGVYYAAKIIDFKRLHRHSYDADLCVKREIEVMKQLRDKSIVALREVLHDPRENHIYMILELAECGEILSIRGDGSVVPFDDGLTSFSEDSTVKVISGALRALMYTHHLGIAHRDVKPANILLTADGSVKLCDFSVSAIVHEDAVLLRTRREGSVAFLPPEMLASAEFETACWTPSHSSLSMSRAFSVSQWSTQNDGTVLLGEITAGGTVVGGGTTQRLGHDEAIQRQSSTAALAASAITTERAGKDQIRVTRSCKVETAGEKGVEPHLHCSREFSQPSLSLLPIVMDDDSTCAQLPTEDGNNLYMRTSTSSTSQTRAFLMSSKNAQIPALTAPVDVGSVLYQVNSTTTTVSGLSSNVVTTVTTAEDSSTVAVAVDAPENDGDVEQQPQQPQQPRKMVMSKDELALRKGFHPLCDTTFFSNAHGSLLLQESSNSLCLYQDASAVPKAGAATTATTTASSPCNHVSSNYVCGGATAITTSTTTRVPWKDHDAARLKSSATMMATTEDAVHAGCGSSHKIPIDSTFSSASSVPTTTVEDYQRWCAATLSAVGADLFKGDVFALGVTAFTLLMGHLPWTASDASTQLAAVLSCPDPFRDAYVAAYGPEGYRAPPAQQFRQYRETWDGVTTSTSRTHEASPVTLVAPLYHPTAMYAVAEKDECDNSNSGSRPAGESVIEEVGGESAVGAGKGSSTVNHINSTSLPLVPEMHCSISKQQQGYTPSCEGSNDFTNTRSSAATNMLHTTDSLCVLTTGEVKQCDECDSSLGGTAVAATAPAGLHEASRIQSFDTCKDLFGECSEGQQREHHAGSNTGTQGAGRPEDEVVSNVVSLGAAISSDSSDTTEGSMADSIVLCELLRGKVCRPYTDTWAEALPPSVVQGERGEISAEAVDFVRNCLSLDPAERRSVFELFQHPWIQRSRRHHQESKCDALAQPHAQMQATETDKGGSVPMFCELNRSLPMREGCVAGTSENSTEAQFMRNVRHFDVAEEDEKNYIGSACHRLGTGIVIRGNDNVDFADSVVLGRGVAVSRDITSPLSLYHDDAGSSATTAPHTHLPSGNETNASSLRDRSGEFGVSSSRYRPYSCGEIVSRSTRASIFPSAEHTPLLHCVTQATSPTSPFMQFNSTVARSLSHSRTDQLSSFPDSTSLRGAPPSSEGVPLASEDIGAHLSCSNSNFYRGEGGVGPQVNEEAVVTPSGNVDQIGHGHTNGAEVETDSAGVRTSSFAQSPFGTALSSPLRRFLGS